MRPEETYSPHQDSIYNYSQVYPNGKFPPYRRRRLEEVLEVKNGKASYFQNATSWNKDSGQSKAGNYLEA